VWKWLFPLAVEELAGEGRQCVTGDVTDFLIELDIQHEDDRREVEKL